MANEIKVHAETRQASGSTAARRFRRAGIVPAVLSNVSGESRLLTLNNHDFERMLSKHFSEHLVVTLAVGDEETLAIVREIQRHGLTGKVLHVDFGEITADHKLHVAIPITLRGEPDGVHNQGGVLEQQLREIEVSCLPGDVLEKFEVDVSRLKLGEALLVGELALGEAFTVLTSADIPVATVVEPAAAKAADSAADDEAAETAAAGKAESDK